MSQAESIQAVTGMNMVVLAGLLYEHEYSITALFFVVFGASLMFEAALVGLGLKERSQDRQ